MSAINQLLKITFVLGLVFVVIGIVKSKTPEIKESVSKTRSGLSKRLGFDV